MSDKNLCFLFLDDDKIRRLSSLAILKRLMEIINLNAPSKSCEYFNMIEGTNTGGLIAIMLDRLEMNKVVRKKRHRVTINRHVQERFDIKELERSIRDIIKRKNKAGENALLKGSENQQCKVLVLLYRHLFLLHSWLDFSITWRRSDKMSSLLGPSKSIFFFGHPYSSLIA